MSTESLSPEAALSSSTSISNKGFTRHDPHIWGIYILLIIISVIELYSASSREVTGSGIGVFMPLVRHMAMLFGGLGIMLFLEKVHYRHFYFWSLVFVAFSVLSMIYVYFFGAVINGARRSILIAGFQLQPAEFIKFSAVLVTAFVASRTQMKGGGVTNKGVAIMAATVLVFGLMLIKQGLTNTLLLMGISLSMFLIAGVQFKKLMIVVGVYIACFVMFVGVVAFVEARHEADKESGQAATEQVDGKKKDNLRIETWMNRLSRHQGDGRPKYELPITADNRQEMFSYMAQANGGIPGVLPGNSRETARLPLAFSDYIYAIIVEDLGLWGGLLVLVLYLWLMMRASAIAARCTRCFPALLVLGMAVLIAIQALFHMAIVTGFAPVSGQPLPLISKGGSSIIVTSLAFGVMLSVSRHTARSGKRQDVNRELSELPDDLKAANPTRI